MTTDTVTVRYGESAHQPSDPTVIWNDPTMPRPHPFVVRWDSPKWGPSLSRFATEGEAREFIRGGFGE